MIKNKDKMLRCVLMDRSARLIAISGKNLVEKARELHSLSRVCTAALGRTLMMTSMMGIGLKGEDDRVTAILKGGGMAGNVVCTATPEGTVKGYIENPTLELPPAPNGKLDVALAVGWFGDLTVIKDMGLKEPYVGKSQIFSGEIAEDFANYFTVSEQTPSLVYLGVQVDIESGAVLSAGGIFIQTMPNCPDETIDKLTEKANDISTLSTKLKEGMELTDALWSIFEDCGIEILQGYNPEFKCDCSRERLERVLISLGKDELADMAEKDHGAQLTCHFCNTVYDFNEDDLNCLIKEITVG